MLALALSLAAHDGQATIPMYSEEGCARQLDTLGVYLDASRGRFVEAESILRESFRRYDSEPASPIMLRVRPRACAESAIGVALAGQRRFAEAEPLLLRAFEEMRTHQSSFSRHAQRMVTDAFDAVIALYVAWDKPDKVAEWQAARP